MKEYKIIPVPRSNGAKDFSEAEQILAEMSEKGWELVSLVPDSAKLTALRLIAAFQRDVQTH